MVQEFLNDKIKVVINSMNDPNYLEMLSGIHAMKEELNNQEIEVLDDNDF